MEQSSKQCPSCGYGRNPAVAVCPNCDKAGFRDAVKNGLNPFDQMRAARVVWVALLAMFLPLVLPLITHSVVLFQSIANGSLDGATMTMDMMDQYMATNHPNLQTISMTIGQGVALLVIMLILRKYLGSILATFKNYKNIVYPLAIIAVVFGISFGISNFIESVLEITSNENQALVEKELQGSPVISFLSIAIGAPLLEELTFRCGVQGLLNRKNKVLGIVVATVLFVLIHLNVSGANLTAELISIPGYVLAGASLGLIYNKYGLAGSFIAHAFNNAAASVLVLCF